MSDALTRPAAQVRDTYLEMIDRLRANYLDRGNDPRGLAAFAYLDAVRELAVYSFLLDRDVAEARRGLAESVRLYLELFARHAAGEGISDDLVSMLGYQRLLDALASGFRQPARELALCLGSRPVGKKADGPFDRAMGRVLKAMVLGDEDVARQLLPTLERSCKGFARAFRNYPVFLSAVLDRDEVGVQEALNEVLKVHRRQSAYSGAFAMTGDARLAVWVVGLVNLALDRGLAVKCDDPLVPRELAVGLE